MPYSSITHTSRGADALMYAIHSKSHMHGKERNLLVSPIGFSPGDYYSYLEQFEDTWKYASSKNKNQVRRIIISWSTKELDPNDPDSPEIAYQICAELMQKAFYGFPAVVCIQNDGKGEKLHAHVIASNVNVITHKGFDDIQTSHWYLQKNVDKVCEKFIEIDPGLENSRDRVSRTERRKREENIRINEENAKLPMSEKKQLKYIWKDDLKARIRQVMKASISRDDFAERLFDIGVAAEYRSTKGHGDFLVYELMDSSNFPNEEKIPINLKCKSYKLGSEYDICELDNQIKSNVLRRTKREKKDEVVLTDSSLKTSDRQVYTEPQKKNTNILQKNREDMLRAVLEDIEDVDFDNLEVKDLEAFIKRG